MNAKEKQIIHTAIALFSSEGMGVATARIAKEAGVSNGTLFNYFKTKQELIDSVYLFIKSEFGNHVLEKVESDMGIKDLLKHIWDYYTRMAIENPEKSQAAIQIRSSQLLSEKALSAADKIYQSLNKRLDESIQQNELADMPVEYLYELTSAQMGATVGYATKSKLKGKKLQQFLDQSFALYWNGIKK